MSFSYSHLKVQTKYLQYTSGRASLALRFLRHKVENGLRADPDSVAISVFVVILVELDKYYDMVKRACLSRSGPGSEMGDWYSINNVPTKIQS